MCVILFDVEDLYEVVVMCVLFEVLVLWYVVFNMILVVLEVVE